MGTVSRHKVGRTKEFPMRALLPLFLISCAAAHGATGEGKSEDPPVEVFVTVELDSPNPVQVLYVSYSVDGEPCFEYVEETGGRAPLQDCCPDGWFATGTRSEEGSWSTVCVHDDA
jgi:hypothetical protein